VAPRLTVAVVAVVVSATLAAGCVTRDVRSYPSRLREHATELQTRGRATVEALEDRPVEVRATTRVAVSERQAGGARLTREVTIGELVAGCDASPGEATTCLADQVVEEEMVVAQRRERRVGAAVGSAFSGAIGVAAVGFCIAECTGRDLAIGAGVLVGGALLFALMAMTLR
jgi:outer membrane murein-binding lipoprotein Lpp